MSWIAYDAETVLAVHNFAAYEVLPTPDNVIALERGGQARRCRLLGIAFTLIVAIIMDEATTWVDQLPKGSVDMGVIAKRLLLPRKQSPAIDAEGSAMLGFLNRIKQWRKAAYRNAARRPWVWRELSVPPSHQLLLNVRQNFGDAVTFTPPAAGKCNVGFVLHIASFGGVERVAYCVAQQLSLSGAAVHLFLIGTNRAELPEDFSDTFASINFLEGPNFGSWDGGNQFQGTALPSVANHHHAIERIVAALAGMDVVFNHHAGDLNEAAAALRRLGVKTATYLHLLDNTPSGRPLGHPVLALAYEHAYDLVICVSNRMLGWMHGAGVPSDKLLLVRNAPGHDVPPSRRKRILKERVSRKHDRLRVLFLGRLDRQKGIGRLATAIDRSAEARMPLRWRVVGAAVTEAVPLPPTVQALVEPPVYDGKGLVDLLAWADVMVLLSDYEGVPLSILEAQRLGVVVIATNVGAVSEIIESGRNGFLVSPNNAVDETLALLKTLSQNDRLRSQIALAASDVAGWPETTGELVAWLGLTAEADADAADEVLEPAPAQAERQVAGLTS